MKHTELIDAVRDAAAGEYEVVGEIGKNDAGTVAFLAHQLETGSTVALRLTLAGEDASGVPQYMLDVVEELDESVPDLDATCPTCRKPLRKWVRFCTKCGMDVWGAAPSGPGAAEARRALRREAERLAAASAYEFVGEMPRKAGGGSAYFARDPRTRRIVALRLTRAANQDYEIGITGVVKSIAPRSRRPSPGAVSIIRSGGFRPVPKVHANASTSPAPERPPPAPAPVAPRVESDSAPVAAPLTRLPAGLPRWAAAAIVGIALLVIVYVIFLRD